MNAILDNFVRQEPEKSLLALPERLLLLAVLEQAARDILSDESKVREDALQWFSDTESSVRKQPFSFKWICEQLGLEVRNVLNRLGVEQELTGRQKSSAHAINDSFDLTSWESWRGGWI